MTVDIAKRRRVMERSMQLGHCVCDPRRSCPCDVFTQQGICPCAGERPDPVELAQVKLTRMVRYAGCASKISPADLDAALARLPAVTDPDVLCGLAAADDAAIYRIADNLHLVQTVDVFTPCVDEPRLFGRICAANCLSDIYAMGGVPRTALSVVAFPSETLPGEVLFQMLAGAMETFTEAGVSLIGGHSVKDEEIKLGFAITGLIDPAIAQALDHPHPGDWLVLTKPLGTGVLSFAQQIGRGDPAGLAASQASMAVLNRAAADAMKEAGASAATDITGFGLLGHLIRMMRQHRLTASIFADTLPAFPGVLEALRQGVIPGAIDRNREYVGQDLVLTDGVDQAQMHLGFDPQTSGGLLIAIPETRWPILQQALATRGSAGFVIGRIEGESSGQILLQPSFSVAPPPAPAEIKPPVPETASPTKSEASHAGCCAEVFSSRTPTDHSGGRAEGGTAVESQRAFAALLRSTQAAGVLDAKTKELIAFSLVLLSRCAPCVIAHLEAARELGITQAELDEAAWCAIAMGGAPVRMFYKEALERVHASGGES